MPKTNIGLQSGTSHIAKMSFETEKIHALGGSELFPKLVFIFDVRLSPWTDISKQTHVVHPVTWLTLCGEFCSPEQRAVAMFRDEVNLHADSHYSPETQFRLEIPLDFFTVARIEQSRDGDLRAALNFRAMFAIHLSGALGVERFEAARVEPLVFMIPKSHWVDKLLPQLGYGKIELIEVRIPDGIRGQGLPEAVKEMREARSYLLNGDWEKAVAHCRNTLEIILNSRQLQLSPASKFDLKVDTFIEQHLSAKLGGKQSKLLAQEMKLLWEVCSKSVHPSPPEYFSRADAIFIVHNTTDILQYVSGLLA